MSALEKYKAAKNITKKTAKKTAIYAGAGIVGLWIAIGVTEFDLAAKAPCGTYSKSKLLEMADSVFGRNIDAVPQWPERIFGIAFGVPAIIGTMYGDTARVAKCGLPVPRNG